MKIIIFIMTLCFSLTSMGQKQVCLSDIIDTVFCREVQLKDLGFNGNQSIFLKLSRNDSAGLSNYVYLDSLNVKCYPFLQNYNDNDVSLEVEKYETVSLLFFSFKKKKNKLVEIYLNANEIDKELYQLNQKNKSKVFRPGGEWTVILRKKHRKWAVTKVIGKVYESREEILKGL